MTIAPNTNLPIRIEISDVMEGVRSAMVNVLSTVPGSPMRVSEVERSLGLRKTMAWRVVQICGAPDPMQAAEHMPGPEGLSLIMEAARRAGASEEAVAALETASERFRSLVGNHAPSRPALRRLVAGLSENGRERFDLSLRRAAVEAGSAIWGVHAKAQFRMGVVHQTPGSTSSAANLTVVSGFFGLSRLRENVTWELNHGVNMRSHGSSEAHRLVTRPLDGAAGDAPLLGEFSTVDPAALERRELADRSIVDRLLPGPVGMRAATNVLFGETLPGLLEGVGLPHERRQDDLFYFSSRLRTPCDVAVLELHFQRDLLPAGEFGAFLADQMQTAVAFPNSAGQAPPRLPLESEVERAGRADQAVPLLEVPDHPRLTRWVYGRLGLSAAGFDVLRVRVRFPAIPTTLVLGAALRPDLRQAELGGI